MLISLSYLLLLPLARLKWASHAHDGSQLHARREEEKERESVWLSEEMRTTGECERQSAGVSSEERASEKGRETKERKRGGMMIGK